MKTLSFWKKSVYSAFIFFGTLMILSVGYAVLSSGLSNGDKVGSGSGLTASSWNRVIDGIFELDTRTANIFSSGGNVGIGASPGAKLDVKSTGAGIDDIKLSYNTTDFISLSSMSDGYRLRTQGSAANKLYIESGNSSSVVLNSGGGKVGIGTISPSDTLTVSGGVTATKFTTSTSWTTIPANATWTSGMSCRRVGSFLQFNGHFALASGTVSGWPAVTTFPPLPSNCFPTNTIFYISGSCWTGGTASLCLVQISSTGVISVWNGVAFGAVSFPGTYPAD